jgi:polar amino acid transport system substrate-binding protein
MLFLRIISCAILSIILASCSDDEKTSLDKDIMVVATSADNPPYEYIQDGKIVGLDIDIIEAIAKEMGKKLVIKNFDFPGLLPALSSRSVDVVIAALTVTEERKTKIDFSTGYISSGMAILSRKDEKISSINDLEGKTLGVLMGTTWESYAKELSSKISNIRIRSLSNNLILVEELKTGSIDGVIMEELQVNIFMANVPNLEKFSLQDTKGEFAIALPKDSPLTQPMDEAIKKLQSNGILNNLKAKWLTK